MGRVSYAREIRFAFIDWRLHQLGGINRANIEAAFGISAQQASNDLTGFTARFPSRMQYNMSAKRYEPRVGSSLYSDEQHHASLDVAKLFVEKGKP